MEAKILGERIKGIIKKNGFTQEQIAEYIGVDQTTISKFVNGERSLNFELVDRICVLCGFTLSEVMKGQIDKEPLTFSFRSTATKKQDLETIAEINQIALDLIRMTALERR